ncbi:barstar family protein [Streptomyces sp. JL4002]|uniref:barstar family protein n=1 Tax=Streptomyces TaxID=1883 RepID=UPI00342C4BF5
MTLEPEPIAPALAAAEAAGWDTVRLDLDGVRGKAGLMRRCGEALRLPEWVGGNWDALADALRDLSWLPDATGRLVAVTGWGGFAAARPREWETFLEVLEEAAGFWREPEAGPGPELRVVLDGTVPGAPSRTARPGRRRD